MRVAVVGATGRIGRLAVAALHSAGHESVPISRSDGVDVSTGTGLSEALAGVDAVIDTYNDPTAVERAAAVTAFGGATRNLLTAEQTAGVRHHVLLSIVNARDTVSNAHYAGKVAQEDLVEQGDVPWSIVPATQFHDFAEMVTEWTEQDGSATIAPLLVQPIAPADIAQILVEVAVGAPQGRYQDVAGPHTEDLVDMARRTRAARGTPITLIPTWRGMFGAEMAGEALIPHGPARLAPTSFDDWLAAETG